MATLHVVVRKAMKDKSFRKALGRDLDVALARKRLKLTTGNRKQLRSFLRRKYRMTGLQLLNFVALVSYGRSLPPPPLWPIIVKRSMLK
jgi:hypothetical protein